MVREKSRVWWTLLLVVGTVALGSAIADRWESWLYNLPRWVRVAHPVLMVVAVVAAVGSAARSLPMGAGR